MVHCVQFAFVMIGPTSFGGKKRDPGNEVVTGPDWPDLIILFLALLNHLENLSTFNRTFRSLQCLDLYLISHDNTNTCFLKNSLIRTNDLVQSNLY